MNKFTSDNIVRLLDDNVMIYPLRSQTASAAGLTILGIDKTAPKEGIVVAVGPGIQGVSGKIEPIKLDRGDRVVYAIGDLNEIKVDNDIMHIIPATEVLSKIVK